LQQLIGGAPVQVNSALSIPEVRTKEFLKNATQFVLTNHVQLENTPYVLVLADPGTNEKALAKKDVLHSCGLGNCVFFVDEKLRLRKIEDGEARISICSALTDVRKLFALLVANTFVYKILCGKIIDERDIKGVAGNPLAGSKWHRPIADFDLLLQDHLHSYVRNEQGFRFWFDKGKRILLSGKHGTEEIFHRALFWWLKNYVSNKLKVYGQPKGLGQDETDIIVVTMDGSYLIEIKWLGENESGTSYDQEQINIGLAQVKIYLDGDEQCVCGHLVVYDGRCRDDHKTKSVHDDALRHVRCTVPKIIFLESETPSKKAIGVAKNISQ
jgi:hypothetical protein